MKIYPADAPIKEKISTIARRVYGAAEVTYTPASERQIAHYQQLGYGPFPICMAKARYSLSHDPARKGRPEDFALPLQEVRACTGAGFLCPIVGDILTMPGLPGHASLEPIDIDERGNIVGLL